MEANNDRQGNLIIFSLGANGDTPYYKIQSYPEGNWSEWISLGGNLKQIDTALDKSGRLNIFGIGSADNGTYYKYQLSPAAIGNTTRWSEWISLGGESRQLEANNDRQGNLIIFSLGANGDTPYYKIQSYPEGNWSEWISLGGNLKQIDTALDKSGRLNIFGIGSADNGTYYKYQLSPAAIGNTTRWSDWISLGGESKQLEANNDRQGNLIIFSLGANGDTPYYKIQSYPEGNWSEWISLSEFTRDLSTGLDVKRQLVVFLIDNDGVPFYKFYDVEKGDWRVKTWTDIIGIQEILESRYGVPELPLLHEPETR